MTKIETIQVKVFHQITAFRRFDPETSPLEWVYTYDRPYDKRDDLALLGEIFRENNVVDGDEQPVVWETRSLSVGDVVQLGDGGIWAVEPVGWRPLSKAQLAAARERGRTFDPFMGLHSDRKGTA